MNQLESNCSLLPDNFCYFGECSLETWECECDTGYQYDLLWTRVERCTYSILLGSIWSLLIILIGFISLSFSSLSLVHLINKSKHSTLTDHNLSLFMIALSLLMIFFGFFSIEDNATTPLTTVTFSALMVLIAGPIPGVLAARVIKPRVKQHNLKIKNSFYLFNVWSYVLVPSIIFSITILYTYQLTSHSLTGDSLMGDIYMLVVCICTSISNFLAAYHCRSFVVYLQKNGNTLLQPPSTLTEIELLTIKQNVQRTYKVLMGICISVLIGSFTMLIGDLIYNFVMPFRYMIFMIFSGFMFFVAMLTILIFYLEHTTKSQSSSKDAMFSTPKVQDKMFTELVSTPRDSFS